MKRQVEEKDCPMCGCSTKVDFQKFNSSQNTVYNIAVYSCNDIDCQFTWLPEEEERRIKQIIVGELKNE